MLHRLKCIIGAALCVAASICGFPVVALDGPLVTQTNLGSCSIQAQVDPGGWSVIFLDDGSMFGSTYTAGLYYYDNDVGTHIPNGWIAINASFISTCLGGGAVTNFIADDTANAARLASDAYMGFSFDHAGTHYEYAMVGATATHWVANTSPVDTTPPTATIVVADNALAIGETSLVTITFSEAVTGFDNSDLNISNGALSAVTSSDGGLMQHPTREEHGLAGLQLH